MHAGSPGAIASGDETRVKVVGHRRIPGITAQARVAHPSAGGGPKAMIIIPDCPDGNRHRRPDRCRQSNWSHVSAYSMLGNTPRSPR